ncbi:unnamed protein product, partial [marine sediment metagenome]
MSSPPMILGTASAPTAAIAAITIVAQRPMFREVLSGTFAKG